MINAESAQANSHTIADVEDNHLSKHNQQPLFCLPNEKDLSKTTTTKLYPTKKWETNLKQQCVKNKRLFDYSLIVIFSRFKTTYRSIQP